MFSNALENRGYKLGQRIGKGSVSEVFKCQFNDKTTGSVQINLCCKIIDKNSDNTYTEHFLPREIELLRTISHPSIVEIHSIIQSRDKLFVFMRWAEKGDLLDEIRKVGLIPEIRAKFWFHQICDGLNHLHNVLGWAHRDLKCENILLTAKNNAKIGDFGYVRNCVGENGKQILSETYCGSAGYAAPEVLSSTPYDPFKSDVWSAGVILFSMLNGVMPFSGSIGRTMLAQMIGEYKFSDKVINTLSDECIRTVKEMLVIDPNKRFSVADLLNSSWLSVCNVPLCHFHKKLNVS